MGSSFLAGAVVGSGLVLLALFLMAVEVDKWARSQSVRAAADGRAQWRRRLEAEEAKFKGAGELRRLLAANHVVLLTMWGCGFCEEQERLLAQSGLAGLVETRVCVAGVPECEGVRAYPTWRVMRGDKFASTEGFMRRQALLDWLKGATASESARAPALGAGGSDKAAASASGAPTLVPARAAPAQAAPVRSQSAK